MKKKAAYRWDAAGVRRLRGHLDLTQAQLAEELGVRQQTVSEWETGVYRPRGASGRLLGIVADQGGFPYAAAGTQDSGNGTPEAGSQKRKTRSETRDAGRGTRDARSVRRSAADG